MSGQVRLRPIPATTTPALRLQTRLDRIRDTSRIVDRNANVLRPDRDLRTDARTAYRRAYGTTPVEVHHRVPLEWRFLFPHADPNRLANLQGLRTLDHRKKASDMWDSFRNTYRRLRREPTPAEILRHAMLVDRSLNLPPYL
jgi:hypothetical protein